MLFSLLLCRAELHYSLSLCLLLCGFYMIKLVSSSKTHCYIQKEIINHVAIKCFKKGIPLYMLFMK
jgi:hypothetical protein